MANSLTKYRQKRNFSLTPEPSGVYKSTGQSLRFVVQKHAARRLHYDFRLELGATLKSWAVPKGPSLDPSEKRLAVHVEDHPLDYADFEGVIPAKQYGAGKAEIWDRGRWIPVGDGHAGYRSGKLKFRLEGNKLNGGWNLVRTKLPGAGGGKEQWLLIKERDEAARPSAEFNVTEELPNSVAQQPRKRPPAATQDKETAHHNRPPKIMRQKTVPTTAIKASLPRILKPQLATLIKSPPEDGDWSYEIKFDGYRLLARVSGSSVRLFTRNGNDWTSKLPLLASAIKDLDLKSAWLDGEIVVVDKDGHYNFQELQNAFEKERISHIQYFLFDLPYFAGHDLRQAPLSDRRLLLRQMLTGSGGPLHVSDDLPGSGQQILTEACRLGLEGVVGKRKDSPYVSVRSQSWIKLKCQQRQEFVVGGFTGPQGSREKFGALC